MTAPRRENIPGYSANCRDSCNWEEAARQLRVRRSMTGPMLSRLVVCGQRRFPIRPEAMCRSTTSIWTTAEQRAKR